MEFSEFIKYIPKIRIQQLPAVQAHLKMAPIGRQETMGPDYYEKMNPRKSAVMMLFYPKDGETHLVLTKRNAYPGVHSSQISFPGGKAEPEDANLAVTALRETFEEIGVEGNDIDIVMPFSEIYIPPSNFLVQPFLGMAKKQPEFKPDPKEVTAIIQLPLDTFLDDSIITSSEMQTSYSQSIKVPAFVFEGHVVWGATAMIMSELKETIKMAIE